ncbi:LCP family protein [Modestobacter sp. KNN46-3]|uniref:LCP family protein n=1 Tax=Modestobacter sp. KNN46-3 TaxID=2711218 RepID=UPI001F150DA0|nr:LCP family protein [Modestobacter sp. KNN46-3]
MALDLSHARPGFVQADSSEGQIAEGPPDGGASSGNSPDDRRRRRRLRRALVAVGVLMLVVVLVAGGGVWYLTNRYGGNIDRVGDVFADMDEDSRPAAPSEVASGGAPVTFLLVGSDTRAQLDEGELPDARSDAIMIARLAADRQHAQVISIPRDSWVDIPGHGMNKINAAYAFGGPPLLIQTVEQLTGVRIDHYAAISFAGLIQVTDDLGGVDVVVPETTSNGAYTFTAGPNHLNGEQAKAYVAQRYGLPGGDFDRVKRQQNYLRSMFGKLFSSSTASDLGELGELDSVLRTVASAVAVDDTLGTTDLLTLGYFARSIRPDDVAFFTAPVMGTGREGTASVVYLDATTGERMWGYLQTDSLSSNTAEFSDEALPETPR